MSIRSSSMFAGYNGRPVLCDGMDNRAFLKISGTPRPSTSALVIIPGFSQADSQSRRIIDPWKDDIDPSV